MYMVYAFPVPEG